MDADLFAEQDYETQYFGFHPRAFTDGIYNAFHDYIHHALNTMQEYLIQEFGEIMPKESIQSSTESLLQTIMKSVDKAFDKLEVYLNDNVFNIPSHIVLPEDHIHLKQTFSEDEEKQLDLEIAELKQKIINERIRKAYLKQKLHEQKTIKEDLNILKNRLQKLKSIAQAAGIVDVKEDLSFAVSKAVELQEECESL